MLLAIMCVVLGPARSVVLMFDSCPYGPNFGEEWAKLSSSNAVKLLLGLRGLYPSGLTQKLERRLRNAIEVRRRMTNFQIG